MCSLVGAALWDVYTREGAAIADLRLNKIFAASHARGRDGRGYFAIVDRRDLSHGRKSVERATREDWVAEEFVKPFNYETTVIGNLRAEPTTEYVERKIESDQQPYSLGNWNIVHNGTIANDKELRTHRYPSNIDSAAIVERLTQNSGQTWDVFKKTVRELKGSFAILASRNGKPGTMFAATNYRPIWYVLTEQGYFFASSREFLKGIHVPAQMLAPYSIAMFDRTGMVTEPLHETASKKRALVVCSGGLDSTVAAAKLKADGFEIELIHFQYGSRAEGPEVEAVKAVAKAMNVKLTLFPLSVYDPSDSPLLRADSTIAGGEEGAEFAHEWVPARNLVLLSVAVAYAEAKGFSHVALGNNLEEAGAYPDNEPEFIDKFNDLLPFAVGDGKSVKIIMPVGNLMKHEIVALGAEVNAPLDKTWSCYRAGKLHCGHCGPCFMRRTAFKINGIPEVIHYEDEQ